MAGRDHVPLMLVARREAVEQREPGAGTAEKPLEPVAVRASGMIDELGPAITVARNRPRRLQRDRGSGPVQPLDQAVPSGVEPQILWLVHHSAAVFKNEDPDRAAAIVRIGQLAFDVSDPAGRGGTEKIPA